MSLRGSSVRAGYGAGKRGRGGARSAHRDGLGRDRHRLGELERRIQHAREVRAHVDLLLRTLLPVEHQHRRCDFHLDARRQAKRLRLETVVLRRVADIHLHGVHAIDRVQHRLAAAERNAGEADAQRPQPAVGIQLLLRIGMHQGVVAEAAAGGHEVVFQALRAVGDALGLLLLGAGEREGPAAQRRAAAVVRHLLQQQHARTGLRTIWTPPAGGGDITALAWSPDGNKLALTYGDKLVVWDLVAGSGKTLPPEGNRDLNPSWSTDGTQIVFRRVGSQTQSQATVKADLTEAVALLRRALWQTEHDQNCDIVVEVDGRANRTIEPCTCAHNPIRAFLARVDGAK